ncbi:MAG: efflux RND transporter periplasmic adaptor subunit [Propionibacteriaceae bacterium]|nr:efflux RND transporter periplasmic adaptor subunit [Propionibacteriaceae bacterium]
MSERKIKAPPIPVRIAVLVLLLAGGGYWWWASSNSAPADQATVLTGTLEANEYQIAPAIAGQVKELKVAEGDKVEEGQVLAELDPMALELQVEQAQQGVTVAKAALTNAKNDDDSTKADIDSAKAKVEQAQAAVKLAKAQLAYATVKAPASGTVTSVSTNVGQTASPAKTMLVISQSDQLFARVYVQETDIGNVKVGQAATGTTDSSTDTFSGKVTFVASEAQFTPNTIQTKDQRVKLVYEVRVQLDDSSGTLKPGMPVDVTLS